MEFVCPNVDSSRSSGCMQKSELGGKSQTGVSEPHTVTLVMANSPLKPRADSDSSCLSVRMHPQQT